MRQVIKFADIFWSSLPPLHKILSLILTLIVLIAIFAGDNNAVRKLTIPNTLNLSETAPLETTTSNQTIAPYPEDFFYTISSGDTLSSIFDMLRISQASMYDILETDLALLALDTLKPGDSLRFWLNPETEALDKLEIEFNPAHKVIYKRVDAGGFEYEEINLPGTWKQEIVNAEVKGSFYYSAQKAGLDASDIMEISSLLKEKINFNKGFRAGDTFQVVRSKQMVGDRETGESRVEGVRIINQKNEVTAFLYEDSYYDKNGVGMERAFSRYPLAKNYRITSNFNPKRRHPITRLIRPHNGTDFGVPVGTPVLSTGDGVVVEVKKHPYAGLYIKLKHGLKFQTRYLHLQKAYVTKGQTVTRGQKIALSGNSGRSTGAHLHFELLINNKPVNAMKADIPIMKEIEGKDRQKFKTMVSNYLKEMGKA